MSDIRIPVQGFRFPAHKTQEPAAGALEERVLAHPQFRSMAAQKSVLGWIFSAVIFAVYVSFIWIIGTNPQLFAEKVNPDSVITWGIYIGVFVIVFSFVITGVYVLIANGRFEKMTQTVVDDVLEEGGGK